MNNYEFDLQFNQPLIGCDEAGRGALAGPVVAAAVIGNTIPEAIRELINDSKLLSKSKREYLYKAIKDSSVHAVAQCSELEIEKYNILHASLFAMQRAAAKLSGAKTILIDGNHVPKNMRVKPIPVVKGDQKSLSIAAASILAKVHRDNIMKELSKKFPMYGWEGNAGYPTKTHKLALKKFGISIHHRKEYAPVKQVIMEASL